jgi:predicted nucleotide-binding protein
VPSAAPANPQPAQASVQAAVGRADAHVRVAVLGHHDAQARDAASAFIRQLGLQVAVRPDAPKPTEGGFLEQAEDLRGLDFAVVLLPANVLDTTTAITKLLSRELMLELGFLRGTLGQDRICFLLSGNAAKTLPWNGITQMHMDEAGLWHLLLARTMKQAGLDVDLNRAV